MWSNNGSETAATKHAVRFGSDNPKCGNIYYYKTKKKVIKWCILSAEFHEISQATQKF
jgi:hypothetical protein